jgi:hypothetical protein
MQPKLNFSCLEGVSKENVGGDGGEEVGFGGL